ncbi:MAG TPA: hypothetical protein VMJ92_02005, partial [Candidatus Limnocylindrales bacterium]|nr:hypothetical protein [Candidatus Limnocylindrales bacterium]
RDDVHGAKTGVLALVRAQVDLAYRRVYEGMGGGFDRPGRAGEGEDGPVVVNVTGPVEKAHTVDRLDRGGETVDDVAAAAFTDVGNAFDETRHGCEA